MGIFFFNVEAVLFTIGNHEKISYDTFDLLFRHTIVGFHINYCCEDCMHIFPVLLHKWSRCLVETAGKTSIERRNQC